MQLAERKSRKGIGGRGKIIELPTAIEDVIKRYESGVQVSQIAKDIGLTERTLYRRLIESESKWKPAQEAQALQAYETDKRNHAEALNHLNTLKARLDDEGIVDAGERNWRLAHTKALVQSYEKAMNRSGWELERVLSRIYAQKQDVTVNIVTDLANRLHHARERLVGHGSTFDSREPPKSLNKKDSQ